MGKPLWAAENYWITRSKNIYARSEDDIYCANNLSLQRLYPSYKSADFCVDFNGENNYAACSHDSEFNATAALTIETILKTSTNLAGRQTLLSKADSNSGYLFALEDGKPCFQTDNSGQVKIIADQPLDVCQWYRLKAVFYNGEVKLYCNWQELGCTVVGTVPNSLAVNTHDVYLGAEISATNLFKGKISHISLVRHGHFHSGYLSPNAPVAYWDFDKDLKDSSANGFHLEWNGDQPQYSANTLYQVIGVTFHQREKVDFVFIDRRHNLTTGAKVKLCSGSWAWQSNELAEKTVEARKPLVFHIPETEDFNFHLEINDPANKDGFVSIPYLFMGKSMVMQRGFLKGNQRTDYVYGSTNHDGCGGINSVIRSMHLYHNGVELRLIPGDRQIIETVARQWQLNRPVVFSEDVDDEDSYLLVKNENPLEITFTHRIADIFTTRLGLREVGT